MTRFAMLDQQVSLLDPALSIRDNFRRLNPRRRRERLPRRARPVHVPRRRGAAGRRQPERRAAAARRPRLRARRREPPPLLILDEPTNHLDIDSIEAVEAGLRAYDGALLVVSHDEAFLEAIGITRRLAI